MVAGLLVVLVEGSTLLTRVLERALAAGVTVEQVSPRHETLEDLFVREAIAAGEAAAAGS